ncbi:MAG: hypothetical protein CFE24_06025 [Flavobacterium sp. BFFFF2]|nr:MAG: hypothetical protein CFE24_06025 [Flavobacterium sp. BFFFF2]
MKYHLLFLFSFLGSFAQSKSVFDIARTGTLQEIQEIFKTNPALVNDINEQKSSPLILACYRGNIDVALFLMDHIKDINYNSGMGTALMAAVVKGNIELVKMLIDKKAKLDETDSQGKTALMYAVQFKNTDIISLLLAQHASKSLVDKEGKTAFEYAAFSGDQKIINLLK